MYGKALYKPGYVPSEERAMISFGVWGFLPRGGPFGESCNKGYTIGGQKMEGPISGTVRREKGGSGCKLTAC